MYMVEITHEKVENLAEHLEKGIRYIGKAMQCIDELKSEHSMGERMGYRDHDGYPKHWEDDEMGHRRGRYSRY